MRITIFIAKMASEMRVANMHQERELTAIDLFSGCGGLTEGLKNAGFRVLGAVDIEPIAVATYKMNHPEVNVWRRNIRRIPTPEIMRKLKLQKGDLDLLAGCPPCQGFSSMRTLNGKKTIIDDRNDLIFAFLRLVKKLKPKTVMMENVPGLLTDGRLLKFKEKLEKMGYKFGDSPMVLNVAEYGVPQRRRRMILMASRYGIIPFARKEETLCSVREAIANLVPPGNSNDPIHDLPEKRSELTLRRISHIPKDGGSRTALPPELQLECHKKYPQGFKDVYGRMKWDTVSPTITGGCTNPSKGRFLHPEQNRAITLREAALLQSFRPDYQFSLKKGKDGAALMIGNALPPEFIKRQATQIKNHLLAVGKQAVCA